MTQRTYSKSHVDKKHAPCTFKVGKKVKLSTKNINADNFGRKSKLRIKYCGPFRIIEKLGPVTFRIKLSDILKNRIHELYRADFLKPYKEDKSFRRHHDPPTPIMLRDGTEEYKVHAIWNHKLKGGRHEYLVKWLGCADHENTWLK